MSMFRLKGKSAYQAIACGSVFMMEKRTMQISNEKASDAETEVTRVIEAIETVKTQMETFYQKALTEAEKESAEIFRIHQMLLEDEGFKTSILKLIREESLSAERAVSEQGEKMAKKFSAMDDVYMKARGTDLRDVSMQLLRVLKKQSEREEISIENAIIVAEDIFPSELLQIDRAKVSGIVTVKGSTLSHTAILARMMGIPYLAQVPVEMARIYNGMEVVVDTYKNEVIFAPTEEVKREVKACIRDEIKKRNELEDLKGKQTITTQGQSIRLYANIGSVEHVDDVLENDAEGIGLFRTEFLCLEKNAIPTENEQFEFYKKILMAMDDKPVSIRTFDIREDKQLSDFEKEQAFRIQVRALLRAAVCGKLSVIYPMICDVDEVEHIKSVVTQAQNELKSEGIECRCFKQGIMIETKEAVALSNELAHMVDFFSIGTNDLIRENPNGDVLSMIEKVISAGHAYDIHVAICGELAANLELIEKFVELGVDELSVVPTAILPIRKVIREL